MVKTPSSPPVPSVRKMSMFSNDTFLISSPRVSKPISRALPHIPFHRAQFLTRMFSDEASTPISKNFIPP